MTKKLLAVFSVLMTLILAGCSSSATTLPRVGRIASATTINPVPIPVRVTGIAHGEHFAFECATLNPTRNAESTLIYTSEGDIFVSCHNATLGISANTTIKRPSVGVQSDGRVAITINDGKTSEGSLPDIITTETTSSSSAGYVSVSEWDANTKHLVGTSAMWWSRAGGEKGEVKIEYDVSRQTYSL